MSTHAKVKKAKLEHPANHYKSPDEITKDVDLSEEEKRQALNTWEQDARQMMTASNEGMEGDDEGLQATRSGSGKWCGRKPISPQRPSTKRRIRIGRPPPGF
jgi:hypothetical protein